MRIHIGERDQHNGRSLHKEIVELLRKRHYAGATVFRGAMGFGAGSKPHSDWIEALSLDMPILVECVETEERLKAILPEIDGMIGDGLITLERARVIMYRPREPEEEEPDDWSIDVTGTWEIRHPHSPGSSAGVSGRAPGPDAPAI